MPCSQISGGIIGRCVHIDESITITRRCSRYTMPDNDYCPEHHPRDGSEEAFEATCQRLGLPPSYRIFIDPAAGPPVPLVTRNRRSVVL